MTQKTTQYRLCLSTNIEATGPVRSDEETLERLQAAFTEDEGRRYSLHAEAIAYHLRELLRWALTQPKRVWPNIGLDASCEPETRRVVAVDCFLKTGAKTGKEP